VRCNTSATREVAAVTDPWETFKHAYERLERAASPRLERALRSRVLLAPASVALSGALRGWALWDAALGAGWSRIGLSTRAEHEALRDEVLRLEGRLGALGRERFSGAAPRAGGRA
jgi:hypothetical protein